MAIPHVGTLALTRRGPSLFEHSSGFLGPYYYYILHFWGQCAAWTCLPIGFAAKDEHGKWYREQSKGK